MPSDTRRENLLRNKLSALNLGRLRHLNPVCITSVDSTQDYLTEALQSKSEGDFVVSDIQTKGRGREGRTWHSDLGGLYLSISLIPRRLDVVDKIPILVSRAIMETLEIDLHLSGCTVKAPNDVICHGKKIGGVLVDAELKGETAIAYVGIGVDINNGGKWGEEMKQSATSYFLETGKNADLDDFVVRLLMHLDNTYNEALKS